MTPERGSDTDPTEKVPGLSFPSYRTLRVGKPLLVGKLLRDKSWKSHCFREWS